MLSFFHVRPPNQFVPACVGIPFGCRGYAKRRLPDPSGLNYDLLMKLVEAREKEAGSKAKNPYKVRAFDNALRALEGLAYRIQRVEDVRDIPGIGQGIERRVEEFLLREQALKAPLDDNSVERRAVLDTVRLFQTVSGIGSIRARKLAEAGARTLSDIRDRPELFDTLPKSVQTALKYQARLIERIPRASIERIEGLARPLLTNEGFEVYFTGSYRRRAESSSDIDILLFHPTYNDIPLPNASLTHNPKKEMDRRRTASPLLSIAVPSLTEAGILAEALTSGPTKWQGIAQVPEKDRSLPAKNGKYCRLDLTLMPSGSKGAALVGMTGDVEFVRHMRLQASKAGARLNDHGLWRRPKGWTWSEKTDTKDDAEWELVETPEEGDVFRELGLDSVEPVRRNLGYIVPGSSRRQN